MKTESHSANDAEEQLPAPMSIQSTTPKPASLSLIKTVTTEKATRVTRQLLSDSDSDDDDDLFMNHVSIFRTMHGSKKSKEASEETQTSNTIELASNGNDKSKTGGGKALREARFPDEIASARMTPKAKTKEEEALMCLEASEGIKNSKAFTPKTPPTETVTPYEIRSEMMPEKEEPQTIDLTSPSDFECKPTIPLSNDHVPVQNDKQTTCLKQTSPLGQRPKTQRIFQSMLNSDLDSVYGNASVRLDKCKAEIQKREIDSKDKPETEKNETKETENEEKDLIRRKASIPLSVATNAKAKPLEKVKVENNRCTRKDSEIKPKSKPKPTLKEIKEERQRHLSGTAKAANRALQLMLWDVGFMYNIYAHQFEAVRFVAGLVPEFPFSKETNTKMAQDSKIGTELRALAIQEAAKEFDLREKDTKTTHNGYVHTLPTKGMLLADEMGLGKTIEALAGAALRNAMKAYNSRDEDLPTLIVCPQDGIQNQWYETLVKSGVHPSNIHVWGDSNAQAYQRQERHLEYVMTDSNPKEDNYVLCTRYNIQSELRKFFKLLSPTTNENDKKRIAKELRTRCLFTKVPVPLIEKLRNLYQADKGKEKNKYIEPKEKPQDCVGRVIRTHRDAQAVPQFSFQTIVVDEAHFCKNVLAYWGLGLGLLGTKARRTVLLTGTPYNNGPSDMTSLMTYIDPTHEAAKIDWWDKAVESTGNEGSKRDPNAADVVSDWRKAYLLRRTKDVLLQKLPPRLRSEIDVPAIPSELYIYQCYESMFLRSLRKLRNNLESTSPEARFKAKKVFEIMMACMSCMRMCLVHPILAGGREMTIHFSPSRRHLLKREERPRQCVFCMSHPTITAGKEAARKKEDQNGTERKHFAEQRHESDDADDEIMALTGTARTEMDLDDDQLDDDDFDGDYATKSKKEREREERKKGPIVPLGADFCLASESACRHFAHEKCIEARLKQLDTSCPRCHDLKSRMHANLPHNKYCQEINTHIDDSDSDSGGFTASAKIEKAIKWFQGTVPAGEKAIFLSFFKGSLDLMEGILVSKLGIDCARYDGDVSKEARTSDLERFKTSSTCRVLLATVQSGGTGLNITEANHVCFLDRWFNPCVHDQAESRCHRIGQTKSVNVAYLDINCTIDIVMKRINRLKEGNASVILADGTSLGDRWSLGYRNVSGVIGETMNALRDLRDQAVANNGDAPLPPYMESDLENKMAEAAKLKAVPNVTKVKSESQIPPQIYDRLYQNALNQTVSSASSVKSESHNPPYTNRFLAHSMSTLNGSVMNRPDTKLGVMSRVGSTTMMPTSVVPPQSSVVRPSLSNATNRIIIDMTSRKSRPDNIFTGPPSHRSGTENRSQSYTMQNSGTRSAVNHPFPVTQNSRKASSTPPKSLDSWVSMKRNPRASSLIGNKRTASTMLSGSTQTPVLRRYISPTPNPQKKSRFSRGLSAIVSQKQRTKEMMRRKKRGDL